jgi:phage/plasmid-like protein (TIGR03299 family)
MVAAIASNGKTDLFASHREPAWHGLGTVFQQEVTDYTQMLDLAGLSGWNVREEDLHLDTEHTTEWAVSAKAIVATMGDVERVLGVTGSRYEIVQNEEAFSFLQSLHDGARWETAGAIKGGRVVFGSMAFDRDFVLDPTGVADVVKSYLLVHTSHDGSTGVAGGVTPVRVVCQNTLNLAIQKGITQKFNIRHTIKADERMRAEAEAWRVAHTYMDAFEAEAQALYTQKVSDSQFMSIVEGLFPRPVEDKKGAQAKWDNRVDLFSQAWNGTPNAGIKGTGWGALNALTEANQWGRKTQNTTNGAENFAAAGAGFDIPTNQFRNDALVAVKSLV